MEDEYQVNAAAAPITSDLNMRRNMVRDEINALNTGSYFENVNLALTSIFDLLGDVVIAVHRLETGTVPPLRSEIE